MATSPRAPLSISRDHGDDDETDDPTTLDGASIPEPLDERVVRVVRSVPPAAVVGDDGGALMHTLRPARLAAALGLSVEDAAAELCGLLAAVGGGADGARFAFERPAGCAQPTVMVFHFPTDVAERARRTRRKESLREALWRVGYVVLRVIQIVTSFGLVLSLLILCVAAIAGLVAAMVALSRAGHGGRNESQRMMRHIRSVFYTIRQLLWCFALFGPDDGGEGSFYREIAYDTSLCLSVCCGNPMSAFYWLRMNELSRRRRRAFRGWAGRDVSVDSGVYGVQGVSLIRRGDSNRPATRVPTDVSAEYRGLLSVAVEFLFGTSPFQPGPSSENRWQLRAAFLVDYLSKHAGISLARLSPFVDDPPLSLEDKARIQEQGLLVIAHFNGIPNQDLTLETSLHEATFTFPELMAESEAASRFEPFEIDEDPGWMNILYKGEPSGQKNNGEIPRSLKESLYRLTSLPRNLFMRCVFLGSLNLVGVLMLGPSLEQGGVLEIDEKNALGPFLKGILMPVLRFYALLFFVLPLVRLLLILVLNARRRIRNDLRARLASEFDTK